jgi:molybdopterin-containing oxidoreductase family iron-sulfur binding subunit
MTQQHDGKKAAANLSAVGSALPIVTDAPVFWRSLDELAGGGAALESGAREVSHPALEWLDGPSRRDFLRYMGASLALGGVAGCAYQPPESIVPYVQAPEQVIPGKPLFFASAVPIEGFACGVLVKSEMGRPIKIEGNPDHPASLGATDTFAQAELLSLYDPDRSQLVIHNGRIDTWEHFLTFGLDLRQRLRETRGAGFRVLTQTVASPTLADQLRRLFEQFPQAKWHCYEPVTRDAIRSGCRLAFGEDLEPIYHVDRADVIVSLESDFLAWGPGRLAHARAFARRRGTGMGADAGVMNRLYVVECTPSLTGAAADHRLALPARDVAGFARAIAARLGVGGKRPELPGKIPDELAAMAAWITAVAADLEAHRGRSLVLAGDTQPPEVHALAHRVNHALGNDGKTVEYVSRADAGPSEQIASLNELARDMNAGAVETLVILGGNPAYDAPADLEFAKLLASGKTKLFIHLGLYDDETARACHWHIPEAHCLERWSDLRAFDGTATIQQPLISPLYKGKSAHELLAVFLGEPDRTALQIIRDYWKTQALPGDFEQVWNRALETGLIAGTARAPKAVTPREAPTGEPEPRGAATDTLAIVFRPDPTVWDGRFANNGWLQELPKPLTKVTWDNAALLSPALARRLGVENEDLLELRYQGHTLVIPAWIMPGQADRSVTVFLGNGRRRAGRVGTGVGVDVYGLRTGKEPWFGAGLEITKTGDRRRLAAMHHHFNMQGRDLIRVGTLDNYRKDPAFAQTEEREAGHGESLYEDPAAQALRGQGAGNAWGMAIDLNTCIGCGACVVACQAENNIPVVGREQVLVSREMHWIRVDRYFEGEDTSNPKVDFQPVPCMHCEKAPCEVVCPVGATTHSAEGLNEMTYNRCVGTRYCSNNCPYKVRRFNFLAYNDETTPSLKLLRNPDVTVRARGVMEKCTYCVQRINAARINAEIANRSVGGDEVVTACQAACPTQAIVFGNLNDRASAVARAKASPRNYALLGELNTRPRTTYLAKLRNPNPEIEASARDDTHRT